MLHQTNKNFTFKLKRAVLASRGAPLSIETLLQRLGETSFGLVLIILALPAFIPVPMVPSGLVFGPALALIAWQCWTGAKVPRLPDWIGKRELSVSQAIAVLRATLPVLNRIEPFLRPRWKRLTGERARTWLSIPIFIMGAIIALPIPFGNQVPGLALIAFAFGMLARDGGAIFAGLVLSTIAVAWTGFLFAAGAHITNELINFAALRLPDWF